MKKLLTIGWKDLSVTFHDRAALILMLAAPFVLTVGIAFTTGRFSDSGTSGSGLEAIPVVVVNEDTGPIGEALVQFLSSEELASLLTPAVVEETALARAPVDDDEAAVAILIPAGFSETIREDGETSGTIELYINPARAISAGVVRAIVGQFLQRFESERIIQTVAVQQLVTSSRIAPAEIPAFVGESSARADGMGTAGALLRLRIEMAGSTSRAEFDPLAYIAPAMALLFLMYTVSHGGRSILAEREEGTLTRILATPTSAVEVLGGKVLGIFLTGLAQVGILILTSHLLFGIQWGRPFDVLLLLLAVVAAATGWGILLAAVARTATQVTQIGGALMLLFGIMGGSFVPINQFPASMRLLSSVTPNRWGLVGFTTLAEGGGLAEIQQPLVALALMAAALFGVAIWLFRRPLV